MKDPFPPSVLLTLCAVAFLMMFGLSILFPVLPYYARALRLSEFEAGILASVFALTSVLCAPLWGKISDRYGRRFPLALGLVGFSLGFLAFGLGDRFYELFLARVVGGIFGSAALPTVMAMAATLSNPGERSRIMGWIGASIGLGILFGPALGGILADAYGVRAPFFFTAFVGMLGAMGVAWLPPTPPSPQRIQHPPCPLRDLKVLLLFGFLSSISQTSFEATLGFLIQDRFRLGPRAVGLFLAGLGMVGVLLQGGGIQFLTRHFKDLTLLRWGTLLIALGLLGIGESPTFLLVILSGFLFALGNGLARPTYGAILSRRGEAFQGEAQGLGQSAQSLGRAVGPLIATFMYQHLGISAPYIGVALLTGMSILLLRTDTDPILASATLPSPLPGKEDSSQ